MSLDATREGRVTRNAITTDASSEMLSFEPERLLRARGSRPNS